VKREGKLGMTYPKPSILVLALKYFILVAQKTLSEKWEGWNKGVFSAMALKFFYSKMYFNLMLNNLNYRKISHTAACS
jgi:hypothetical protein